MQGRITNLRFYTKSPGKIKKKMGLFKGLNNLLEKMELLVVDSIRASFA